MNRLLLILLIQLVFTSPKVNAQNWLWAETPGSANIETWGQCMTTDVSGNVYVAGVTNDTSITFGSHTLLNPKGYLGLALIFLVKYNALGDVIWARGAEGDTGYSTTNNQPASVATDAAGNVYLSGNFQTSTLNFGTVSVTNAHPYSYDLFLAKYDSSGNVKWATAAGGGCCIWMNTATTDAFGNTYIAGSFYGPTFVVGTITLDTLLGKSFLAKYDSSGHVKWAKNEVTGSTSLLSEGINVYSSGWFEKPTVTFGSTTLTNSGSQSLFLVKYDTTGNVLWAKEPGTSSGINQIVSVLSHDATGNIFLGGWFDNPTISFGSTTLNSVGGADIFATKLDSSGNLIWARSAGGVDNDFARSIATDSIGDVYIAGNFTSTSFTFGPNTLAGTSGAKVFIAEYNPDGEAVGAFTEYSGSYAQMEAIAIDISGNLYATGSFADELVLGSFTLRNDYNDFSSLQTINMFTARLDTTIAMQTSTITGTIRSILLYPNPTTTFLTISATTDITTLTITNPLGQTVYNQQYNSKQVQLDVETLSSGVYFVKVNGSEVRKFVKQ